LQGLLLIFPKNLILHIFFGSSIIAVFCFFAFIKDIDGIVKINKIIIPFLLFIIILLGFQNLFCFKPYSLAETPFNVSWIKNSFIYASYNLIIVIPILISLKKFILNNRSAKFISIGVSFFMLLMSLILFCLLEFYKINIQNLEIPIVFIASTSGNFLKYACSFAIVGAILTTALSSGYGFLTNLNIKNKRNYNICSFIMCLLSIFLGNIGFSKLLNFLYPILGSLRVNPIIFYTKNKAKVKISLLLYF